MSKYFVFVFVLCVTTSSYSCKLKTSSKSYKLYDNSRKLYVEYLLYLPKRKINKTNLTLILNGRDIKHTEYEYLAQYFLRMNHVVVSILLRPDESSLKNKLLPLSERRIPSWIEGAKDIELVLNSLQSNISKINYNQITLIGHSHGGNVIIYFIQNISSFSIQRIITLDNSLVPLPIVVHPEIVSFRSSDSKSSDRVIPSKSLISKYNLKIRYLDIDHMEFCDRGSESAKQKIIKELDLLNF